MPGEVFGLWIFPQRAVWYNLSVDKLLHNVGDLSNPDRSAVENLMGHPLRDDQQLYIVALDAVAEPVAAERQSAWDNLQAIIADAKDNVGQSPDSADEIERVIDEACNEARYGR